MIDQILEKLKQKGLKVTPQRVAIFEAVLNLRHHPSAEKIINYIKIKHPNISTGTVYKVLDTLVENSLLKKVKSERDVMRYDAILHQHHHLYCEQTERIEDFDDPDLDQLIAQYFEKKKIKGFTIKDITLQINGEFKN